MKTMVFLLFASLLVLTGCSFSVPTTPPVQPASLLQTAVALTLTAEATNGTAPSEISQPAVETETPTPTPLPTDTVSPTIELPSVTPATATATPQPAAPAAPVYPAPAQSPSQFIRYYFGNINVSNYPLTWSLLTSRFQLTNNPDGYAGYVNFWNTVHSVTIEGISVLSQSGGYASVNVRALYHYTNDLLNDTLITYNLIYDYNRRTWLFDSPGAAYVPYVPYVPAAQSPSQFVYYYYSNINASNFSLTWTLMTERFKSINNPSGYADYVNYWNTVNNVQVLSVSVLSQSGYFATVSVSAIYNLNIGIAQPTTNTFNLLYDNVMGTWMFDS